MFRYTTTKIKEINSQLSSTLSIEFIRIEQTNNFSSLSYHRSFRVHDSRVEFVADATSLSTGDAASFFGCTVRTRLPGDFSRDIISLVS